jgi:hypothetical protein
MILIYFMGQANNNGNESNKEIRRNPNTFML